MTLAEIKTRVAEIRTVAESDSATAAAIERQLYEDVLTAIWAGDAGDAGPRDLSGLAIQSKRIPFPRQGTPPPSGTAFAISCLDCRASFAPAEGLLVTHYGAAQVRCPNCSRIETAAAS